MPFTKQNRFITFLVSMSFAFLLNATYVATINDGNMTSTQERIVTACLLGATFGVQRTNATETIVLAAFDKLIGTLA